MNQNARITDISAYRAARRRAGNIRWVLILVFLVTCMFAGYFFSISSFFAIREIQVEGNRIVEDQRIIELAEVHKGDNIFSVDLRKAAAWIQMEPRIGAVEVKRKLPQRLLIRVEERSAVACMMAGKHLIDLDATGRVLERHDSWASLELPLLSGVDLHDCGSLPGVVINGQGIEEALSIIRDLPADAEDIGEINVDNPQFIKLYTVSGVEIRLGDGQDFKQKYLIYSNILLDNKLENGDPLRYIDVSIVDKPTLTYK